jgi:hypothetical protein
LVKIKSFAKGAVAHTSLKKTKTGLAGLIRVLGLDSFGGAAVRLRKRLLVAKK